jgi:hypothetical protein
MTKLRISRPQFDPRLIPEVHARVFAAKAGFPGHDR